MPGQPRIQYPPPRPAPSTEDLATLATDPLVVYSDEVAAVDDGSRTWPVLEIVSYNLRTHRVVGLFRVGKVGEYAYASQSALVGRSVVVNLERRVIIANLDGSGMRDIFTAPAGAIATTLSVSPDGEIAAIGTESVNLSPGPHASLVLVEIASGNELRRVSYDTFARLGLPGTPGASAWLTNRTLEVRGIAHKGGGGGFRPTAIVSVAGSVELRTRPAPNVGPDGRFEALPSDMTFYGCQGSWQLPQSAEIRDAPSSATVGALARDGFAVEFYQWSPDGSSALFNTHRVQDGDRPGGKCFDVNAMGGWQIWSLEGGVVDVPDLRPLLQGWYGGRFIDLECEGNLLALVYPLSGTRLRCNDYAATPPATLLAGGETVGAVHDATIIGFTGP